MGSSMVTNNSEAFLNKKMKKFLFSEANYKVFRVNVRV